MLYNETNNFDEIKTLFPDKTEIEVVIRPCLPRADHRVPGGLILRKLMVCFSIIRFFPVLTKLQETFGGCDVFTATRWWEEANQAAAPGRRPTLEWQATWGQGTREKLFRCWLFCVICNCLCSWRKRAVCVFNIVIRWWMRFCGSGSGRVWMDFVAIWRLSWISVCLGRFSWYRLDLRRFAWFA